MKRFLPTMLLIIPMFLLTANVSSAVSRVAQPDKSQPSSISESSPVSIREPSQIAPAVTSETLSDRAIPMFLYGMLFFAAFTWPILLALLIFELGLVKLFFKGSWGKTFLTLGIFILLLVLGYILHVVFSTLLDSGLPGMILIFGILLPVLKALISIKFFPEISFKKALISLVVVFIMAITFGAIYFTVFPPGRFTMG
jgi:hypothetical protein